MRCSKCRFVFWHRRNNNTRCNGPAKGQEPMCTIGYLLSLSLSPPCVLEVSERGPACSIAPPAKPRVGATRLRTPQPLSTVGLKGLGSEAPRHRVFSWSFSRISISLFFFLLPSLVLGCLCECLRSPKVDKCRARIFRINLTPLGNRSRPTEMCKASCAMGRSGLEVSCRPMMWEGVRRAKWSGGRERSPGLLRYRFFFFKCRREDGSK
ncbi:hypothetical protein LZ31DRAFT_239729 [Colletotrichum somersetense]|nr:hypothetical protein LZ31DRAFT_239729 [Colletotrichum somersetense]